MLFSGNYFYYLTIALQAICLIHCLRKRNEQKWIYIIVFLPVVGCIAYAYTEMFQRSDLHKLQSGVGSLFNSSASIKKLEQNLKFSDTFNNRIMLADAYLATGQTDNAIDLYKASLTGAFTENEYVHTQLMMAYFQKDQYEDVVSTGKKIYRLPQFARSAVHILYARALSYTGNSEQADKEFKMMTGRFANYEARYYYGLFLLRMEKQEDARRVFSDMISEASHLSSPERSTNRSWFGKAKEKLKEVSV